jgi:hypothetical protein
LQKYPVEHADAVAFGAIRSRIRSMKRIMSPFPGLPDNLAAMPGNCNDAGRDEPGKMTGNLTGKIERGR